MRVCKLSWLLAPLTIGACADSPAGDPAPSGNSPVDVGFTPLDLGLSADAMAFVDTGSNGNGSADAGEEECVYPDFVSPMTVGSAIAPWSWPRAIDAAGVVRDLSMRDVFCNSDDVDWSPFDLLLFISIPAW